MADLSSFFAAMADDTLLQREPALCRLMAQDIFTATDPVAAVASPVNAAQLADLVRIAAAHGVHLVARGGGMSYSAGYLSADPAQCVIVDMRRLDRVIEVNAQNMYVVVEPGCTWAALHEVLAPLGLRAAFWGTLSGRNASIGGGISQNALFWGAGTAGTAVDSVLGLEIVTGTGAIIRTGSLGIAGATPFFRHFGPDLTGVFSADCGSMGFKTKIVLRLVRTAKASAGLSFLVPDVASLCGLMSEVARVGLAAQQMGLDDGLKAARLQSDGLFADVGHLWRVIRGASNMWRGLGDGLQLVLAGHKLLDTMPYSVHLFLEAGSAAGLAAVLTQARALAAEHGAREVPASVPTVMLAAPFPALNGITGPKGERWVPVHCIVPHSAALAACTAIARVFADNADAFARHSIATSMLFTSAGTNGFVIEPMFLWPDALDDLHRATLSDWRHARLETFPAAPEARAVVAAARQAVIAAVDALGAVHIQLGQTYPYLDRLEPATAALSRQIRTGLDPLRVINPDQLGDKA